MSNPLEIRLHPSPWLTGGSVVAGVLIALPILGSTLPWAVRLPLITVLLIQVSWWIALYGRLALPSSPAALQVLLDPALQIRVTQRNGRTWTLARPVRGLASPLGIVLRSPAGKPWVVLGADSLCTEDARRLRMLLRNAPLQSREATEARA